MSGYGGRPPGSDDPYGSGAQGWDPYGDYAYYGYGYGPPGVPQTPTRNGSTIAALVCNCLLTAFCCGLLAIPGIITSGIALGRTQTDPDSARNLTLWSWVIFAINIALMVALVVIAITLGAFEEDSGSGFDSGY